MNISCLSLLQYLNAPNSKALQRLKNKPSIILPLNKCHLIYLDKSYHIKYKEMQIGFSFNFQSGVRFHTRMSLFLASDLLPMITFLKIFFLLLRQKKFVVGILELKYKYTIT